MISRKSPELVASNFAHFNSSQKDNISAWFSEKSKENTVWGKWIYSQALLLVIQRSTMRKYLHNDNEEISRINSSNFFCTSISFQKDNISWFTLVFTHVGIQYHSKKTICTNCNKWLWIWTWFTSLLYYTYHNHNPATTNSCHLVPQLFISTENQGWEYSIYARN